MSFILISHLNILTCNSSNALDVNKTKLQLNSVSLVRTRTIPTERLRFVSEVSAFFAGRGCRVLSATDPHGR
jgi:hypothetical protein